jgi:hypothetical protein
MILGKLELTEQTDMSFGIEVYGTTEQTQNVRLVLEGPDFDIACKCKVEGGEVTAHIPKLKGILPAGVYESRLEVIIDGKIFTPLKEQIELNPLIEFDVKTKNVSAVKEGVKITARNVKVVSEDTRPAESKLEKNIQKAIKEGYEVSKVGDNYVMKKNDLYVGLISEKKIIKSDVEYATLSNLIDGLSK